MHFALADYALDIAQNAVESGAREVRIEFEETVGGVRVAVADDGRGMTEEEVGRALDPFWTDGSKHARRKVGLGLPFLAQGTSQAGGSLAIESEKGRGTRVEFRFPAEGPDTPPTGDLPSLFLAMLTLPGGHEMTIARAREAARGRPALAYGLRRSELAEALGGLERGSSLALLRDFLASQEDED